MGVTSHLLTGLILQVIYLDILHLGQEYLLDTPLVFFRVCSFLLGGGFHAKNDRKNKKSRQRHIEKSPEDAFTRLSHGYLRLPFEGKTRFFFFQASHANPSSPYLKKNANLSKNQNHFVNGLVLPSNHRAKPWGNKNTIIDLRIKLFPKKNAKKNRMPKKTLLQTPGTYPRKAHHKPCLFQEIPSLSCFYSLGSPNFLERILRVFNLRTCLARHSNRNETPCLCPPRFDYPGSYLNGTSLNQSLVAFHFDHFWNEASGGWLVRLVKRGGSRRRTRRWTANAIYIHIYNI